jgi:methylated-DNA-[protein]-cysteine S-methyltransferase
MKIVQHEEMIAEVSFLDEAPQLLSEPASELLRTTSWEMTEYFKGNICGFDFLKNILQAGSKFQHNVWNELIRIPFGNTISYRELALRLGDEKCIRAAASANGKNNIAVAVPCHRVIGSDGSLTGYAGGLWRKKWLLEHEALIIGKPIQSTLFG